jgi:hypothetical protein
MFFEDKNYQIASPKRVEIQPLNHAPFRKFSDAALRVAHTHDQTARGLARTLHCDADTIRSHARRLGLPLIGKPSVHWTPDQDAMVRECGRGLIAAGAITRVTNHSSKSIRIRAAELGVVLVINGADQRAPPYHSNRCSTEYDYSITVGKIDRLLLKLREEFGSPRDEIYPGIPVRA